MFPFGPMPAPFGPPEPAPGPPAFDDNPLQINERVSVFKAISIDDVDTVVREVVSRNLTNAHWPLPHSPDIPELLYDSPTAISIAVFFGSSKTLRHLVSRGGKFDVGDSYERLPIHFASARGEPSDVSHYSESFTPLDSAQRSAMHYAAQSGSQAAAGYLLLQGVPTESRDIFGFTPLMFACRTGNLELVQFFLTNGANRRAVYKSGNSVRTMFHFACESNSPDVVRLFFSKQRLESQTPEGTPLVIAARRKNVLTVEFLLEKEANVNAWDSFHQTALMVAASAGSLEIVTALVEAGANATIRDQSGATALTLAIKTGNVDCALALANIPDALRGGVAPLLLAAKCGNLPLVNFFIERGIGLNDTDSDGKTPLHVLAEGNVNETFEQLCLNVSSLDVRDSKGNTPLAIAVLQGNLETVSLLLDYGASPDVANAKGNTPIFHAISKENVPLVEMLLERGSDVNVKNSEGSTPVLFAVLVKRLDILELLVSYKAELKVADETSHTPLYYARMLSAPAIERFLIDNGLTESFIEESG